MSFNVVGIGEVLWDLLPSGPQLGGAPANFAFHARQFGADAQVITRVGNDARGREILRRFQDLGIDDDTVQVDDRLATGIVTIALDGAGTPQYSIRENVAWDGLELTGEAFDVVRKADAICFGTLAQRGAVAASTIQELVAATPFASIRLFDVNLRQRFFSKEILKQSLEIANVLKLNDHELTVLSSMFELTGDTIHKLEQLTRRFDLRLVALTRAEKGSLLHQSGKWSDFQGRRIDIADTVGAGDAFAAALVMGLLNKFALGDIHQIATNVASFVCCQSGATPVLPPRLRGAFVPERRSERTMLHPASTTRDSSTGH